MVKKVEKNLNVDLNLQFQLRQKEKKILKILFLKQSLLDPPTNSSPEVLDDNFKNFLKRLLEAEAKWIKEQKNVSELFNESEGVVSESQTYSFF